jgi:hypothetical protein
MPRNREREKKLLAAYLRSHGRPPVFKTDGAFARWANSQVVREIAKALEDLVAIEKLLHEAEKTIGGLVTLTCTNKGDGPVVLTFGHAKGVVFRYRTLARSR